MSEMTAEEWGKFVLKKVEEQDTFTKWIKENDTTIILEAAAKKGLTSEEVVKLIEESK